MRREETKEVVVLEMLTDGELVELTREDNPDAFGQHCINSRR